MRFGLDRLWLFLALALPALASLLVALPAVDLAWQLRAGELILGSGRIPASDTFTFTVAGASWVDQQWLAQIALALGYRAGGWELLAVVRAASVAATSGLVIGASMARGASTRTAAILSLAAFVLAAPTLALRPQLFGILAFAILLWLVADRRRHPRRLWLAPLVIALWANVHGSVVVAPVLLGYAWLEDVVERGPRRQTLAVLVVGTLATLVNPFGIGVWSYALGVGTSPEISGQVSEWQRTTPFTVPGLLFYASAIAVAAVVVRWRSRFSWPSLLWLAALFVLAVWTVRGLAWWPFGAAVTIAIAFPATGTAPAPGRTGLNVAVAGLLLLAIAAALPWWRPTDPLTGRAGLLSYAPSELALALRDRVQPGDRVFVSQPWGSWFEWAVPDARYFVDSRIELFPAGVWSDYDTVANGSDGWQAILDEDDVGVVAVGLDSPLRPLIAVESGWCTALEGGDATLYLRQPNGGGRACP